MHGQISSRRLGMDAGGSESGDYSEYVGQRSRANHKVGTHAYQSKESGEFEPSGWVFCNQRSILTNSSFICIHSHGCPMDADECPP